jgi:hypothetical protein
MAREGERGEILACDATMYIYDPKTRKYYRTSIDWVNGRPMPNVCSACFYRVEKPPRGLWPES